MSNDKLSNTIKIIESPTGLINSIQIEYDLTNVADKTGKSIPSIKYDEDQKIIYVPIVLESGEITDRFMLYKLEGEYFARISTQDKKAK